MTKFLVVAVFCAAIGFLAGAFSVMAPILEGIMENE
jgi:hypothetical protein